MRSLNLDQLQTLVAIADLGTFAAASRALHLAPPTVSLHISELESRLGARLLQRNPRRALPTAAGAALIERARRLLKDADDASEQVQRIAAGREGKVRLGTSTGVVVHLLPEVLQALAHDSPGIDVELAIITSAETMTRLEAGTLDVGIVVLPLERPDDPQHEGLQLRALRPRLTRHLGIAHRSGGHASAAAHEVVKALRQFAQAPLMAREPGK